MTLPTLRPVLWVLAVIIIHGVIALLPSGVIFPLFIYPGDDCTPWVPILSEIQAQSNLQFYVVVNPNSGPDGVPGSQPDTNYQTCVAKLLAVGAIHGNLKTLGYVLTGYGSRPGINVTNDIDTYSGWASQYRPDGIFFDEVSDNAAFLSIYQIYASRVHLDFGASFVVMNPGSKPLTSGYFDIADMVVTYEDSYNGFDVSSLAIGTSMPSRNQAVLLDNGPTHITVETVRTLTSNPNLGASFITSFSHDIAFEHIPSEWSNLCASLVAAQVT